MAHQKVGKLKNMTDGYPHQLEWKLKKLISLKHGITFFLYSKNLKTKTYPYQLKWKYVKSICLKHFEN